MQIIAYRKNSIQELDKTSTMYGIEVDVRTWQDKLILQHDPYLKGDTFEDWLKDYKHKTLILNLKEKGLEKKLIELMNLHHISDYFFLDQTVPHIIEYALRGHTRTAVRFSQYESIDTALSLSGKADWIWVDCFTKNPLNKEKEKVLRDAGYKICFVSPELQGRSADTEVPQLISFFQNQSIKLDAVCTKHPNLWGKL